jgi:hypothetical protein
MTYVRFIMPTTSIAFTLPNQLTHMLHVNCLSILTFSKIHDISIGTCGIIRFFYNKILELNIIILSPIAT